MDIIHDRAAGIDISKRDAKVCLRLPAARKGQFSGSPWFVVKRIPCLES